MNANKRRQSMIVCQVNADMRRWLVTRHITVAKMRRWAVVIIFVPLWW